MSEESNVNSRNNLAIISFVLGIVSFLLTLSARFELGILFFIATLITGVIALRQIKEQSTKGKGLVIAGIVLPALLVFWAILTFTILYMTGRI